MVEHVLVPVDGSPPSDAAFDWALDEFDAERVTVLYVVHPSDTSHEEGTTVDSKKVLMGKPSEILERYGSDDVTLDRKMAVGRNEVEAITRFVRDAGVDVVAMGSHGHKGVSRIVLGSVAEGVVRESPVPS